MRIGIDLDGVTADIGPEILIRLKLAGHEVPKNFQFKMFDIAKQFNVDPGWLGQQFADPTFWLNAKPFEDAWTCINKWFSQGHDIFFITCRWEANRPETDRWLNEWDLPFNELFMGMEHTRKCEIMEANDIPILIEDRTSEVEAVVHAGKTAIMLDRTWNSPVAGAINVQSFYEIDGMIERGEL